MRAPVLYRPEAGNNNAAGSSSQANALSNSGSKSQKWRERDRESERPSKWKQPPMVGGGQQAAEPPTGQQCPEAAAKGSSSGAALKLAQQPNPPAAGPKAADNRRHWSGGTAEQTRAHYPGSPICDGLDFDELEDCDEDDEELSECSCSNSLECLSQQRSALEHTPPQQVPGGRRPRPQPLHLHHNSFPLAYEQRHRSLQHQPHLRPAAGYPDQQQQPRRPAHYQQHFRRQLGPNCSGPPLLSANELQAALPPPPPPLIRQNTYSATAETITDGSLQFGQAAWPPASSAHNKLYQAATLGRLASGEPKTSVGFRRSATNVHEPLEGPEQAGSPRKHHAGRPSGHNSLGRRRQQAGSEQKQPAGPAGQEEAHQPLQFQQQQQQRPPPPQLSQSGALASSGLAAYPPPSPLAFRASGGSGDARHLLAATSAFDAFAPPLITSHRTNSPWMRISSIILTPIGIVIILFIVVSPLLHYLF